MARTKTIGRSIKIKRGGGYEGDFDRRGCGGKGLLEANGGGSIFLDQEW